MRTGDVQKGGESVIGLDLNITQKERAVQKSPDEEVVEQSTPVPSCCDSWALISVDRMSVASHKKIMLSPVLLRALNSSPIRFL